ncbi:hypothetical protein NDU88_003381 [Pleurodeles waltl]|uniref:Uncharacterized protein n=1 Tax=Pleurodeles waltl TaxID=8319 RepID=A0AAV7KUT0_PLEWA|nr:hypothetical protein NDU88_003381 [Pleurodeles waltl]
MDEVRVHPSSWGCWVDLPPTRNTWGTVGSISHPRARCMLLVRQLSAQRGVERLGRRAQQYSLLSRQRRRCVMYCTRDYCTRSLGFEKGIEGRERRLDREDGWLGRLRLN